MKKLGNIRELARHFTHSTLFCPSCTKNCMSLVRLIVEHEES